MESRDWSSDVCSSDLFPSHDTRSRAINTVVDAANYIMLDTGQPLHAFDADKVEGNIVVRYAKDGEMITTLDNKEVKLTELDVVIADDKGPLAIAGIKGGKRAEVNEATKNIIIESAHFDASSVRKTVGRVDIRNESSKRFENNISPLLAPVAMEAITRLISELHSEAKIADIVEVKAFGLEGHFGSRVMEFDTTYVSRVLGADISFHDIKDILRRVGLNIHEGADTNSYRD